MIVTRLKKVPWSWVWLSQLPFSFWMITACMESSAFVITLRKFSDNPALIFAVLGFSRLPIVIIAPVVNYLSDRIWTRWGRRKPFYTISNIGCAACFCLMPLAPDFWSLTLLLWLYQAFSAFGKTIFVLAQDVIPVPQRGRGYAIRSIMFTTAIVVYYAVVIGRFDDLYFIGPLTAFGQLTGEKAIYWLAALLFLLPLLIVALGIKEMPIPGALTLRDADGKRISLRHFMRDFFRDIFERRWLALYLFLFGNALASMVVTSPIGPLLYTEQWGYSLQEFGGNVALGTALMIPLVGAIGMLADKFSKMRLFTASVACATVLSALYWLFVTFYLPDHRPTLWQILLFGELFAICGRIGETVLWPLLYEYVPRRRMGTAAAGFEMMQGLFTVMLPPLLGLWIVFYSQFSLPHAGSEVRLVFSQSRDTAAITRLLADAEHRQSAAAAPWRAADIALTPVFRPGVSAPTSAVWDLRLQYPEATRLVEQRKKLESDLSSTETNLKLKESAQQSLVASLILSVLPTPTREKCDALRKELTTVQEQIETRTRLFRGDLETLLAPTLAVDGDQIERATWSEGSELLVPAKRFLTKKEIALLHESLPRLVPGVIAVTPPSSWPWLAQAEDSKGIVVVVAKPAEAGLPGETITRIKDAIFALGLEKDPPPGFSARLARLLPFGVAESPGNLRAGLAEVFGDYAGARFLRSVPLFTLQLKTVERATGDQAALIGRLLQTDERRSTHVSTAAGTEGGLVAVAAFHPEPPSTRLPGEPGPVSAGNTEQGNPAVVSRLASAAAGREDQAQRTAAGLALYSSLVKTAREHHIIVPMPVVSGISAAQKNDYFSVYLFSTAAGIVTLLIIWFFCRLERKKVISKLGVEEDLAGTAPAT